MAKKQIKIPDDEYVEAVAAAVVGDGLFEPGYFAQPSSLGWVRVGPISHFLFSRYPNETSRRFIANLTRLADLNRLQQCPCGCGGVFRIVSKYRKEGSDGNR